MSAPREPRIRTERGEDPRHADLALERRITENDPMNQLRATPTGPEFYEWIKLTEAHLSDPEAIERLVDWIIAGGTTTGYCVRHDLHYPILARWLTESERSRRMQSADLMRDRNLWERTIERMREFIEHDPAMLYNENGKLLKISEMSIAARRTLVGMESVEMLDDEGNLMGYTKKVKFFDPAKAAELMGKFLKMFVQKHELTVSKSLAEILEENHPDRLKPSE